MAYLMNLFLSKNYIRYFLAVAKVSVLWASIT